MREITCSTLNKLWSNSHTVWHSNHISSRWVPVSLQWVGLMVTSHFYPDVMISELFSSHSSLATNPSLLSNTLGQWRIHFMFLAHVFHPWSIWSAHKFNPQCLCVTFLPFSSPIGQFWDVCLHFLFLLLQGPSGTKGERGERVSLQSASKLSWSLD